MQGQSASNLKSDKLSGNVKTVRIEQTWTEKNVESKRVLMTIESYDRKGNKTEWDAYKGSETPIRSLFTYNKNGMVTKEVFYNSADDLVAENVFKYNSKGNLVQELSSNGIKVLYSYDSRNNKTMRRSFDLATNEGPRMFGDVNGRVTYSYDKNNNLIEVSSFGPKGSRVWNPEIQAHRILYSYDLQGRTQSQTVFNEDNSIRTKTDYVYDAKDQIVKESLFTGKDQITTTSEYSYQYDERGNWTVQVKRKQIPGTPTSTTLVEETIYRTIDYWN